MAVTIGIIGAVGTIGSGLMSAGAAGKAASAGAAPLNQARQFQEGVYNTANQNISPWISGGQEALGSLEQFAGLPGTGLGVGTGGVGTGGQGSGALANYNAFMDTPFYTIPAQAIQNTIKAQGSPSGTGASTGQLAQLGQTMGKYASGNFMNYISALQNLSGMGMTGSQVLGQVGANVGQSVGQTSAGLAGLAAGGVLGQAQGTAQALQGVGQLGGILGSAGMTSGIGSTGTGQPGSSWLAQNLGGGQPGLSGVWNNLFGPSVSGPSLADASNPNSNTIWQGKA